MNDTLGSFESLHRGAVAAKNRLRVHLLEDRGRLGLELPFLRGHLGDFRGALLHFREVLHIHAAQQITHFVDPQRVTPLAVEMRGGGSGEGHLPAIPSAAQAPGFPGAVGAGGDDITPVAVRNALRSLAWYLWIGRVVMFAWSSSLWHHVHFSLAGSRNTGASA